MLPDLSVPRLRRPKSMTRSLAPAATRMAKETKPGLPGKRQSEAADSTFRIIVPFRVRSYTLSVWRSVSSVLIRLSLRTLRKFLVFFGVKVFDLPDNYNTKIL